MQDLEQCESSLLLVYFWAKYNLTNCKSQTKCNVADGINSSIDRAVPDVHQVSQLRHHAAVDHADSEPQRRHRDDQVVGPGGEGNLVIQTIGLDTDKYTAIGSRE